MRFTWLFALLFLGANALASPWLWQCRHAGQVVAASFRPAPAAMPCGMAAGKMAAKSMACCVAHRGVRASKAPGASVGRPPCAPTLGTAALPVARLASSDSQLRYVAASVSIPLAPWIGLFPTPPTTAQRQRPPPDANAPPSDRLHTPGLRAPPVS